MPPRNKYKPGPRNAPRQPPDTSSRPRHARRPPPSYNAGQGPGPGSGGFGLTPENLDTFFGQPENKDSPFRDTWNKNREGVIAQETAAANAQIINRQAQQDKFVALGKEKASSITKAMQALAAAGRGENSGHIQTTLEGYGLVQLGEKLTGAAGDRVRKIAADLAIQGQFLVDKSGDAEGQYNLGQWHTSLRAAIQKRMNEKTAKDQKQDARGVANAPTEGTLLGDIWAAGTRKGLSATSGRDAWDATVKGLDYTDENSRFRAGLGISEEGTGGLLAPFTQRFWPAFTSGLTQGDPVAGLLGGIENATYQASRLDEANKDGSLSARARYYVETSNSHEDRAKLEADGWLLSPGQLIFGNLESLNPGARERLRNQYALGAFFNAAEEVLSNPDEGDVNVGANIADKGLDTLEIKLWNPAGEPFTINVLSGFVDLGLQMLQDPTMVGGKVGAELSSIGWNVTAAGQMGWRDSLNHLGEVALRSKTSRLGSVIKDQAVWTEVKREALRAQREFHILHSSAGHAVIAETTEKLLRATAGNARQIVKVLGKTQAIGRVSREVADRIAAAGRTGNMADVAAQLRKEFADGNWNPSMGLLRRAMHARLGRSGSSLRSSAGEWVSGHTSAKGGAAPNSSLWNATNAPTGLRELTGGSGEALYKIVEWAAQNDRRWVSQLLSIIEEGATFSPTALNVSDRAIALVGRTRELNPTLAAMVEDIVKPLNSNLFHNLTEDAQEKLLERLRWAEAVTSIVEGAAGGRAKATALDTLTRLVRPLELDTGKAGAAAVQRAGLSLKHQGRTRHLPLDSAAGTSRPDRYFEPKAWTRAVRTELDNFPLTTNAYRGMPEDIPGVHFEEVPTPRDGDIIVWHGEKPGKESDWFIEDAYNGGKGRKYAENFAGEDGVVYATTVPKELYDELAARTAKESGEVGTDLLPASRMNTKVPVGRGSAPFQVDAPTPESILETAKVVAGERLNATPTLRDRLLADLDAAKPGSKDAGRATAAVDISANDLDIAQEAERLLARDGQRKVLFDVATELYGTDKVAIAARFYLKGSTILRSFSEKVPPSVVHTAAANSTGAQQQEIAESLWRYSDALNFTAAKRESFAQEAEELAAAVAAGASPERVRALHTLMYETALKQFGFSAEDIARLAEEATQDSFSKGGIASRGFGVDLSDDSIELLKTPQLVSQRDTVMRFTDTQAAHVAEDIRKLLWRNGDASWAQSVRYGWDSAKNLGWDIRGPGGEFIKRMTIRGGYHQVLRHLKVLVTTRLMSGALIGVAVGISTGSVIEGVGAGIAGTALVRYRTRISLQNRLDGLLEHGFTPQEWAMGLNRAWRRGNRLKYESNTNVLLPDPTHAVWMDRPGSWLRETADRWRPLTLRSGKLSGKDLDAVNRVLNYQLNPETDEIAHILLQVKAGHISKVDGETAIADFLKTEDGVHWLDRMSGGKGAIGRKGAVAKTQSWIDYYVLGERTAQERLAAMGRRVRGEPNPVIGRDVLQELHDGGHLPSTFHAQEVFTTIASGPKGLWRWYKTAFNNAAYDSIKQKGFRENFYYVERQRQENLFRAAGVGREDAARMADELAIAKTNLLMFRHDNVSRAAHALDWIAPFSGHKFFNVSTWTKQIIDNPGRSVRLAYQGANAFNNGQDLGIFYKEDGGDWTMRFPGQGTLSAVTGGLGFNMKLMGFFALTSELSHGSTPLESISKASMPGFGGPWAILAGRTLKGVYANISEGDSEFGKAVIHRIFPFGPSSAATILDQRAALTLRSFVGDHPVWNFLDGGQGENEFNKMEIRATRELVADHILANPADVDWLPSRADVEQKVRDAVRAWNMASFFLPAAPHPEFLNETKFKQVWESYIYPRDPDTMSSTDFLSTRRNFLADPRFAAYSLFLNATGEWDNLGHEEWVKSGGKLTQEEYGIAMMLDHRKTKTWSRYTADVKWARENDAYQRDWRHANATPSPIEREQALSRAEAKHPKAASRFHQTQMAEADLAQILKYPPHLKDAAEDRWRHRWRAISGPGSQSVSRGTYRGMVAKIQRNKDSHEGSYAVSDWNTARRMTDIMPAVGLKRPSPTMPDGVTLSKHVLDAEASLTNPVEKYRLWMSMLSQHNDNWTLATQDPERYLQVAGAIKKHMYDLKTQNWQVFTTYPKATDQATLNLIHAQTRAKDLNFDPKNRYSAIKAMEAGSITGQYAWTQRVNQDNVRFQMDDLYRQINAMSTEMDKHKVKGGWATYYALKPQRDALYDKIREIQNASRDGVANAPSVEMHDAIRELAYLNDVGASLGARNKAAEYIETLTTKGLGIFHTDEEVKYDRMSGAAKVAYTTALENGLDLPGDQMKSAYDVANVQAMLGKGKRKDITGKVYWTWLTDFQRSLLEKNRPGDIDRWKAQDAVTDKARSKAAYGRGRNYGGGYGSSQMGWASAMMKQYSKRSGMAKPAGYAEYLALGNNPALKAQYLEAHADVAAYVAAGPMANMPPVIQMMVANIMIESGKWDGETMDINQLTDISFAREQLERYNRRTGPAPSTYDQWLNMPSGQAKADFIKDHPEIKLWIQQGPMANMPEAYRDVVRDIMYRYHEWTASTDGMGQVLSEYYRTPSYARQDFLLKHPELAAYWAAQRNPADEAMGNLVDAYFANPDAGAKAGMLAANPLLKQYLLDSRTRRYERFLNQVAQFMGQNPEMFQSYLEDQTSILKNLLDKFAEPNLAREEHWLRPVKARTRSAEGGRTRS